MVKGRPKLKNKLPCLLDKYCHLTRQVTPLPITMILCKSIEIIKQHSFFVEKIVLKWRVEKWLPTRLQPNEWLPNTQTHFQIP